MIMSLYNRGVLITIFLAVHLQACTNGCFECASEATKCTACMETYELTILGGCVKSSIAHCSLYLNETYCLRCSSTYFAENNTCVKDWSGCYKTITNVKCSICSPELFLINGTCFGVLNCLKYGSDMTCVLCDQNFTLIGNICMAKSDNCFEASSITGVCVNCQANYRLIGYKCISIAFYNPNCEIYDKVGRCLICKNGFILYQSNCYGQKQIQLLQDLNQQQSNTNSSITNLVQDTQDSVFNLKNLNQSNVYSPGIVKLSNANTSKPQDTYCKQYEDNKCIQCYSNFHVQFGVCKVNNPLCREIYSNGSCKSCYPGYLPQAETCILEPVNLTINLEVIKQISNALESSLDKNCVSSKNNLCLQCESGYYINSNGTCSLHKANCLIFNLTNGNCFACTYPYVLINDDCIYPTANCLLYIKNNQCYQCSQGFYLQDKTCYPNDITCEAYDLIGRCTKCVETYYLINSICVYPALGYDPYCIKYSNSYCSSCLIGYFLQDYRCSQINPKCRQFDYQNKVCLSCGSGLTINGPNCT